MDVPADDQIGPKALDQLVEEIVAGVLAASPADHAAVRRHVVNPDPGADGGPSRLRQEILQCVAHHRAVPPRADGDPAERQVDMLTVDMPTVAAHVAQPPDHALISGAALIRVVVAAADDEAGRGTQTGQVFGDHDDLRVQIGVSGDVQQIARHDHEIVAARHPHQPVILAQAVMQIGDDQRFHEPVVPAHASPACGRAGRPRTRHLSTAG